METPSGFCADCADIREPAIQNRAVLLGLLLLLPQPTLLDYSIQQWRQTPKMQIEDAYKWLFHATLGGEHAVMDDSGPRQWMDAEWPTLTAPLPKEPVIASLRPDRKFIRINLRPYRAQNGDQEFILALFVSSARQFREDKKEFAEVWSQFGVRLKKQGTLSIKHADWARLDKACRPAGWPAIDHSDAYVRAYRPAYRVVRGAMVP